MPTVRSFSSPPCSADIAAAVRAAEAAEAAAAAAAALPQPQPAVAPPSAPAAAAPGDRWIGEELPTGEILFRDLSSCCGYCKGEQPDGTILFQF
jgi:hypothetical protein